MRDMPRTTRTKTQYRTVSLPKPLAEDILTLIEELGYWPSLGAFVREASLEKMKKERNEKR